MKSTGSWRRLSEICAMAVCAIVLMTGSAQAQQVILQNGALQILDGGGNQSAYLTYGADLSLGGGASWCADISSNRYGQGNVLYFSGCSGDLTLGGGGSSPVDGDLYLKDTDGTTTTINMDGSLGYIILGAAGSTEDGDLRVNDSAGSESIYLDGASGNVTNQFAGNGLIKAWARINSDGTVASCWRCNTNASETYNTSTGYYYVDFTFAADITSRPVSGIIDSHASGSISHGDIMVGFVSGDPSSVWVRTEIPDGTASNRPFTLFVY